MLPAVRAAAEALRGPSRFVAVATRVGQLGTLALTVVAAASELREPLHLAAAAVFFFGMGVFMLPILIAFAGPEEGQQRRFRLRLVCLVIYAASFVVMGLIPWGDLCQRSMEWVAFATLQMFFLSLRADLSNWKAAVVQLSVAEQDAVIDSQNDSLLGISSH
jgi:hypothetical protein